MAADIANSYPPLIRFSGTPVEKPDLTPKWERPSNWPRIDLINMYGLSYHVYYLIVRKPVAGHGLCFAATVALNASTWYMERITVSDDGKVVTPVEGSRQTSSGTGSTKIDYQFPDDDPVGTIYAMKVAVTDETKKFSTVPSMSKPTGSMMVDQMYNSGVILEAIVRTPGVLSYGFGAGSNNFVGPTHLAVYSADKGFSVYAFRGDLSLSFLELREGTVLDFVDYNNPNLNASSDGTELVCDWDDDVVVRIKPVTSTLDSIGKFFGPRVGTGKSYPLANVKTYTGGSGDQTPLDWASVTRPVSEFFRRSRGLLSVDIPDGFGANATNVVNCFGGCFSLASLTLPAGFGANAKDVSYCFSNCYSLASLTLPAGFGANATNVNSCFNVCVSLASLTLPAGFGANAKDVSYCFSNCYSLVSIDFGEDSQFGAAASSADVVRHVFDRCFALTTIIGAIKFPWSFYLNGSSMLTHDSLMNVINGLVTVTTAQTLTLGSTNKAKLSDEEIAVATAKGWTIA